MDTGGILKPGSMLIEEYEVVRLLGAGGFGNTYLARDIALNRDVAIKEYFPKEIAIRDASSSVHVSTPSFDSSFRRGMERFVQEARLLARFRHPNIVRVFRTFDANETAYIVLDFVRGVDLDVWLDAINRPPTQAELDELFVPLVDALELVHTAGVLHRDIKPQNICVREETGDPVLLDFGASKYSLGNLAGTTMAIVSRGYSAYEAYAADSSSQGAWTDIYGLGATMYRTVTMTPPPEATERLLHDTLKPLAELQPAGFRIGFLKAIDWALQVQPGARPQNVSEWRNQLFEGSDISITRWQTTRLLDNVNVDTGRPSPAAATGSATSRAAPSPPRAKSSGMGSRFALGLLGISALAGGGYYVAQQLDLERPGALRRSAALATLPSGDQTGTASENTASNPIGRPLTEPSRSAAASPSTTAPNPRDIPSNPLQRTPVAPPSEKTAALDNRAATLPVPRKSPSPEVPTPEIRYDIRKLGKRRAGRILSVAAASRDGRTMVAGSTAGNLMLWDLKTGKEISLGDPAASPIVAIDFAPAPENRVFAATADGRILAAHLNNKAVEIARFDVEQGVVRALVYSDSTRDLIAISTSARETRILRLPDQGGEPLENFRVGAYLARSGAIASRTNRAFIVRNDEKIVSHNYVTGKTIDDLGWIEKAPGWTKTLAVSQNGQFLARGGYYGHVDIFDLTTSAVKYRIRLGDQSNTRWLAFSADGNRLAIDYQVFESEIQKNKVVVIDTGSGAAISHLDAPPDGPRWVSFLPSNSKAYWLASTQSSTINICEASENCKLTDTN